MTITYAHPYTGELTEVKPGMFGLSRIGGLLGKLIAAGQAFSGDGSRWTHAFIVLDDETVIEAMPGGARIVPIADRLGHEEIAFSDGPIQEYMAEWLGGLSAEFVDSLTDSGALTSKVELIKREDVVERARALKGTEYGYLQYLALGLVSLGFEWEWLRRFIANRGRMICSQLVDETFRRAGIHLFKDKRMSQDVTPGDLANRFGIV